MKKKKVFAVIVASGLVFQISPAFAQTQSADQKAADSSAQSTQSSQDQNSAVSPPSPAGLNDPSGASTATFDKEKFIKETAQGGIAEVNLGQIGTQKAQDPAVKEFAQKLVTDHSKLNDQLKELASKKGITLSTELDAKHQKMVDHLSGLTGAEFDKAFAMHMAKDHKKDIAMFKKAASNTEDTDISEFAKNALPTLQEHLRTVQQWAPDTSAGGAVEEPSGTEKKDDSSSPDSSKDDKSSSDSSQSSAPASPDASSSDASKSDSPK